MAMTFRFRPLAGFTLLFLPLFALLLGLGTWQLERLQWKLGLIAQISRNIHGAPISIDSALANGAAAAQYRRVALSGHFINADEVYVFTTGPHGMAVYHVLTPMTLPDGRSFMIDRGLVPPALRAPATRVSGLLEGKQAVVGVLRTPDRPGLFTPAPDITHRIWYARDLEGMATALHLRISAPFIIEADATPIPGGWPLGGQTIVNLPNDHLQYAITWFLLAAALAIVYFTYHGARGRLAFRSP
jgi:surfeit locus 1 family protein